MDREALQRLLEDVQSGRLTIDAAGARLAALPYEDLGFAKLDVHRALRGRRAGGGLLPGQDRRSRWWRSSQRLSAHHANVLATRCDAAIAAAVEAAGAAVRLPRGAEAARRSAGARWRASA